MRPTPDTPVLLLVDDRPNAFTRYVVEHQAGALVLLRFGAPQADLTPAIRLDEYLRATENIPTFTVRQDVPLETEAERYRAWVARLGLRPTRFCNASEPTQVIGHRFAGLVGLPHLGEQQVRWVRDKTAMKDQFRKLGLRTAQYARVRSDLDVHRFATRHGWPVVLKPVDSFATLDTYLIGDGRSMPAVDLTARDWMVEQYVGGTEWEACALVAEGRVLDVWPSAMPCRPLDIVEGAMNANISVATGDTPPVNLHAMVQRIVSGMHLDHGYLHMEFFVVDEAGVGSADSDPDGLDGIVVGEVAMRMAGCAIAPNHGYAYGFDVFAATLEVYLGRTPTLRYGQLRCVGDLLLPLPGSGRVRAVTSPEVLLRMPGVIEVVSKAGIGDVATARRASNNASGYVHVAGRTVAEVTARMRLVLDAFRIELDTSAGANDADPLRPAVHDGLRANAESTR